MAALHFAVVTLFPEMVRETCRYGVVGRAIEQGLIELSLWNPRDYTHDRHRTVDDRPYGGGPGMVMRYQPLHDAVADAKTHCGRAPVVYLSPQGQVLTQQTLDRAREQSSLWILVAGRYEGVDERFIAHCVDQEWSLGDFVISGGELAALVVIDAMARRVPGVLGDDQSALQDSHHAGLLDYPHYTRPEVIAGSTVPKVLLSGHHAEIARWRMKQALGRTWLKRPDLLARVSLCTEEQQLLQEFKLEYQNQSIEGESS